MTEKTPSYDVEWQAKYRSMISSAEEATAKIKPGQRVFIGTGCAEPVALVQALMKRSGELTDVELMHLLTLGIAPYAHKKLAQSFRVNSFFIAENVRSIIKQGLGDYTPIFLSDIPRLFHSGKIELDVALIQVTPPDANGKCSLGVSVDIVKSAAENASLVIAQVNPNMPRTHGDSFLHVYDLDLLVPVDESILEAPPIRTTPEAELIAGFIAPLVDDGSTVELGIGKIPHSVMQFLKHKKDLGIHTEMITDGIVDLVKSGTITGKYKTQDQGRIVASFCLGTKALYDLIDDNPLFSFQPTEYVNDPFVISRHSKMVAINVALEVDLTGQVCADSLGAKFYSGIGGQVDFNRGASRAEGGKAIIALPSTAKGGRISRIVSRLSSGAGVVTTRGDVHYVVTEYGVAYLHGKSIQERAVALISIAHPNFRKKLLEQAIKAKYLSVDLKDRGVRIVTGPASLRTTHLLADGTQIYFRPIHPTDEPKMRRLFYDMSPKSVYYRFMSFIRYMPKNQMEDFVFVDHRNEVAIVGAVPEAAGEEIVAVGRYYLDPKTNRAEAAFTVHDDWQNKGIGAFLVQYLAQIARRNGIKGFTADVLAENTAMQHVFNETGFRTRSKLEDGVCSYEIDF